MMFRRINLCRLPDIVCFIQAGDKDFITILLCFHLTIELKSNKCGGKKYYPPSAMPNKDFLLNLIITI